MAKRANALTIVLILLIIISLGLGGGIFYLLQKEQTRAYSLQKDLEDIKTKQKVTELSLEDSKKTISDLEAKLTENTTLIDSLNKDLQQEKAGKEDALSQVLQLKAELDKQKTIHSDLENKFTQAEENVKKMLVQLKALESKKTELEAKVKELEEKTQGVELGKIVVNSESPAPQEAPVEQAPKKQEKSKKKTSPELEGKVLVVNKDYNFVVINLGSKDGVSVGNTFSLYHNNKYIGDAKVEKIHDSMAALGFSSADMKEKISEGDKVVRKK